MDKFLNSWTHCLIVECIAIKTSIILFIKISIVSTIFKLVLNLNIGFVHSYWNTKLYLTKNEFKSFIKYVYALNEKPGTYFRCLEIDILDNYCY